MNVETIVQLHYLRITVSGDLSDLVARTSSVKYAETTAMQTGYQRSGPPVVTGGKTVRIQRLLEALEEGNLMRMRENDELLAKYAFYRSDPMFLEFDINFPVSPLQ